MSQIVASRQIGPDRWLSWYAGSQEVLIKASSITEIRDSDSGVLITTGGQEMVIRSTIANIVAAMNGEM